MLLVGTFKIENIDGAWIANIGVDSNNPYDGDKSLLIICLAVLMPKALLVKFLLMMVKIGH